MTYCFVEVVANRVCESSDGVIEDEQILGLILGEGRHQHLHKQTEVEGEGREGGMVADLEDLCQVRHQLSAGLLFQSGKGRACSFLHSLVGIQDPLQQLYTHTHTSMYSTLLESQCRTIFVDSGIWTYRPEVDESTQRNSPLRS